jgi:ParB/RepB/Spo0J family partition protein
MIKPEAVEFSRTNPRGESAEEISEDDSFELLKDSVYKYGVLVPIVVHSQPSNQKKPYRLVDGERRLRAALETRRSRIPAHIAPSTGEMDDFIQAVHIHMLRKQWKTVAQARAFKQIIKELRDSAPGMTRGEALEKAQSLTGCTDTKLKSLNRAAKYPESVLEEVDNGQIAFSYLVQFEESFVEQLDQHYPELLTEFGKNRVREALLNKARKKILTGTRALMLNVVPVIARAKSGAEKAYAKELLRGFIEDEDMDAESLLEKFEKRFPTAEEDLLDLAQRAIKESESLLGVIRRLKFTELKRSFPNKAEAVERSLAKLRELISGKLKSMRR